MSSVASQAQPSARDKMFAAVCDLGLEGIVSNRTIDQAALGLG